jgi:DNA-binding transcriptional ArsR family regulator
MNQLSNTLSGYCAGIFKVIGQPNRIEIINTLRNGEQSVSDILGALNLEQSNTSRHLSVMNSCGLLVSRREGHRTLYALKHKESILAVIDSAQRASDMKQHFTETLQILGQMTRMKIVETLRDGEIPRGELVSKVGGEQSNTAHHLALMVEAGIVGNRMEPGRRSLYRLTNQDYVLTLVDSAINVMAQETINRTMLLH